MGKNVDNCKSCLKTTKRILKKYHDYLDQLLWAIVLVLLLTVVQDLVTVPVKSYLMTARLHDLAKSDTSLFRSISDEAGMWSWLETEFLPSYAGTNTLSTYQQRLRLSPTQIVGTVHAPVRNAFFEYKKKIPLSNDPDDFAWGPVSTIDGRTTVMGQRVFLRQIRSKERYATESPEDDASEAWFPTNVDHACPAGCACQPNYNYSSAHITKNTPQKGKYQRYSGGGYVQKLDFFANVSLPNETDKLSLLSEWVQKKTDKYECIKSTISQLKSNGWVDQATRAVMVEYCAAPFFLLEEWELNKNTQHLGQRSYLKDTDRKGVAACHRIVFEFNELGAVRPGQALVTAKANSRGVNFALDKALYFTIVIITALCLLVLEIMEWLAVGHAKYTSSTSMAFNLIDLTSLVSLLGAAMSYPLVAPFSPASQRVALTTDEIYTQFQYLSELDVARLWFSWLVFVWVLRVTEFLANSPIQVPVVTIGRAAPNLFYFTLFLGCVSVGMALFMRSVYGAASEAFSTFSNSVLNICLGMIGELDDSVVATDLRYATEARAVLAFWSFVMGFVVLTMFVGIVDAAYGETKEELKAKTKSQPAGVAIAPLSKFARCWRRKGKQNGGVPGAGATSVAPATGAGAANTAAAADAAERENLKNWQTSKSESER